MSLKVVKLGRLCGIYYSLIDMYLRYKENFWDKSDMKFFNFTIANFRCFVNFECISLIGNSEISQWIMILGVKLTVNHWVTFNLILKQLKHNGKVKSDFYDLKYRTWKCTFTTFFKFSCHLFVRLPCKTHLSLLNFNNRLDLMHLIWLMESSCYILFACPINFYSSIEWMRFFFLVYFLDNHQIRSMNTYLAKCYWCRNALFGGARPRELVSESLLPAYWIVLLLCSFITPSFIIIASHLLLWSFLWFS